MPTPKTAPTDSSVMVLVTLILGWWLQAQQRCLHGHRNGLVIFENASPAETLLAKTKLL
jgi:hypothetical protein